MIRRGESPEEFEEGNPSPLPFGDAWEPSDTLLPARLSAEPFLIMAGEKKPGSSPPGASVVKGTIPTCSLGEGVAPGKGRGAAPGGA